MPVLVRRGGRRERSIGGAGRCMRVGLARVWLLCAMSTAGWLRVLSVAVAEAARWPKHGTQIMYFPPPLPPSQGCRLQSGRSSDQVPWYSCTLSRLAFQLDNHARRPPRPALRTRPPWRVCAAPTSGPESSQTPVHGSPDNKPAASCCPGASHSFGFGKNSLEAKSTALP